MEGDAHDDVIALETFKKLPPAWPRIALIFIGVLAALVLAVQDNAKLLEGLVFDAYTHGVIWSRFLFLSYAALFGCMWIVYFLSRSKLDFFQIRTLRKLLQVVSRQWAVQTIPSDSDNIFLDKAKISITVIGILTAVAGIELVQVNAVLLSPKGMELNKWQHAMLDGVALTAITALALFLLSADSLDSIFNVFKVNDREIKQRFYLQSLTPRYLAKVMLIWGAIFLVAFHEPILATLAIGIFIAFGYSHWFPTVNSLRFNTGEKNINSKKTIRNLTAAILVCTLIFFSVSGRFLEETPIPQWLFVILAILLWAFSAPLVNRGLSMLPGTGKLYSILCGTSISLASGTCTLLVLTGGDIRHELLTANLAIAGVLTFPIATSLYYGCAFAFGKRAEFAAQFAKVKPILSVLLAVWLLGEGFWWYSYISVALMIAGLALLILGSSGRWSLAAVMLGLAMAVSWSAGEILFKYNHQGGQTIGQTLIALVSGAAVGWGVTLIASLGAGKERFSQMIITFPKWAGYFAAHGIFSFGLAYACFFQSIGSIGVSRTVMISCLWPVVALLISIAFTFPGEERKLIPWKVWVSAAFLLAGSLIQLLRS